MTDSPNNASAAEEQQSQQRRPSDATTGSSSGIFRNVMNALRPSSSGGRSSDAGGPQRRSSSNALSAFSKTLQPEATASSGSSGGDTEVAQSGFLSSQAAEQPSSSSSTTSPTARQSRSNSIPSLLNMGNPSNVSAANAALSPRATTSASSLALAPQSNLDAPSTADIKGKRPEPARRQSSSRRIANALRPIFRRSSSHASEPGSGSFASSSSLSMTAGPNPVQAPVASTSSAGGASGPGSAVRPSVFGTGKKSRPSSYLSGPPSGPPSPLSGVVATDSSVPLSLGSLPGQSGRKRPWTAGSGRAASSTQSLAQGSTPSPGTEHMSQPFPPSFFSAQSRFNTNNHSLHSDATPTHTFSDPTAAFQLHPPVDCVVELTRMLTQPTILTLAQLMPINLITAHGGFPVAAAAMLDHLPGAGSTVSLATTALSEAATTSASSIHQTQTSATSSSQHYHPYTSTSTLPTSGFVCNEQLAASSLNLPTTSVGSIWRMARGMEWLVENGSALNQLASERANPLTPRPTSVPPHNMPFNMPRPGETTFDFASLLQSVIDMLASTASQQGVELSCHHGGGLVHDNTRQPPAFKGNVAVPDLQEAFVVGDERGLGIGLLAVMMQALNRAKPGTSIDVALNCDLVMPPETSREPYQPVIASDDEDDDDDDDDRTPIRGVYTCTIEITHTFSNQYMHEDASPPVASSSDEQYPMSGFNTGAGLGSAVLASLMEFVRMSTVTMPEGPDSQVTTITCTRPQGHGPAALPYDPLRRRRSIEGNREPSPTELVRFIETSLRGKKAAVYGSESSIFIRQLLRNLGVWGVEVNFVSITSEEERDIPSRSTSGTGSLPAGLSSIAGRLNPAGTLGRFDSGFGGSNDSNSPQQGVASPAPVVQPDPFSMFNANSGFPPAPRLGHAQAEHATSPPLDPTLSFIITDDDIPTLRKQLTYIRNNPPNVQLPNTLLTKRPQLQSRRTRSSQAVHRAAPVQVSIIHFTSLNNYRAIKDLTHSIFRHASSMFPLPEVLVVPKPVGPRRLLTTLFNAVKKPSLDPYFLPIATSPSSPGGHLFLGAGRPSPAPSNANVNQFEEAITQVMAQRQADNGSSPMGGSGVHAPRTPPIISSQQTSNPPSPVSPDALEYFSKNAVELGSSASQGIIIQSPDGRATGLFFQPRAASLVGTAESLRMSRASADSSGGLSGSNVAVEAQARPSPSLSHTGILGNNTADLPAMIIPAHIEIGGAGRNFTMPPPIPRDETSSPVLRGLDSQSMLPVSPVSISSEFGAPSRLPRGSDASVDTASEEGSPPTALQIDTTEVDSRSPPASKAALADASLSISSPSSLARTSPKPALNTNVSKESVLESKPPSPVDMVSETLIRPRRSTKTKKPSRRPTGTLVPPINVLIVEDNPINQIILSTFLKRKGIKYSVANNGQEAVDSWKAGDFHLVLMDIQLPVKDGIEATQEIRGLEKENNVRALEAVSPSASGDGSGSMSPTSASPYELPVIIVALTASSLQSDRVAALAAGCNDFLTKPVSLQWLNQKLVEWGSMAYLSGFSNKRRQPLGSPRESFIKAQAQQQSMQGAANELSAKKDKEEMRAKLRALMMRKPPTTAVSAPAAPAVTATATKQLESATPAINDAAPSGPAAIQAPPSSMERSETVEKADNETAMVAEAPSENVHDKENKPAAEQRAEIAKALGEGGLQLEDQVEGPLCEGSSNDTSV